MKLLHLISLLIITQLLFAQELTMFDNVLHFTSEKDFIAHNLYEVASQKFSSDNQVNLYIKGDISSFNFSLAIVSMIPAFKKLSKRNSLELTFFNLTDENFDEAILIEFVKRRYPSFYLEYLLFRAECFFNDDSKIFFELHSISHSEILEFKNNTKIKSSVKNKFTSIFDFDNDYQILINDVKFIMIPEFFEEFIDLSEEINLPPEYEWKHLYFLSEVIYNFIQRGHIDGTIPKNAFVESDFMSSVNDIYSILLMCITNERISIIDKSINYFNPSRKYRNMMEDCDCNKVLQYFNIDFLNNLSKHTLKYKRKN